MWLSVVKKTALSLPILAKNWRKGRKKNYAQLPFWLKGQKAESGQKKSCFQLSSRQRGRKMFFWPCGRSVGRVVGQSFFQRFSDFFWYRRRARFNSPAIIDSNKTILDLPQDSFCNICVTGGFKQTLFPVLRQSKFYLPSRLWQPECLYSGYSYSCSYSCRVPE